LESVFVDFSEVDHLVPSKLSENHKYLRIRTQILKGNMLKTPTVVVCTAIFGSRDMLKPPMYVGPCKYVCFTDKPRYSPIWEVEVRPEKGDPARVAKQYKILTHRFFPHAQYFIWSDGSQQLLERFTPHLVEELLDGKQMAIHRHPHRKCIYREANYCIFRKKDRPRLIKRQMDRYRKEGMPKNYGLIRGGFFIRRNDSATNAFFEKWWQEISTESRRDQLSFDYCRWKMGIKVTYLSRARRGSFRHGDRRNKAIARPLYQHHGHYPGKQIELAIVRPKHSIRTFQELFLSRGVIMSLSDEADTIMAKQCLLDRTSSEYICLMDSNFHAKTTRMRFSGMPRALRGTTGMIVPSSCRNKTKGRFTEVQDITGDCFVMRRSVFEEIGGLDTNYKIGYAERDLARRLILNGYRILQCNRSVLTVGKKKDNEMLRQDKALFDRRRKIW